MEIFRNHATRAPIFGFPCTDTPTEKFEVGFLHSLASGNPGFKTFSGPRFRGGDFPVSYQTIKAVPATLINAANITCGVKFSRTLKIQTDKKMVTKTSIEEIKATREIAL